MKLSIKYLTAIVLLHFSSSAQRSDSPFLSASIAKLQHAKEYTVKVANLMPAEKFEFRPAPDEMSFGEQLLHLSSNMRWLYSIILVTESDI